MNLRLLILLQILIPAAFIFGFGEDREPAPKKSKVKPPVAKPQRFEDGTIRLGEITLDPVKKEVSFTGTLTPPKDSPLEVLIVSPAPIGRAHEGLVVTTASPFQLEAMLILLGGDREAKSSVKGKKGSLVNIDLEWKDSNGKTHRSPIEQWVKDERTGKTMHRQGFFFCGSSFHEGIYQAEGNGNLCLLYSNTDATVLDCPDKDSGTALYTMNTQMVQPGAFKEVRVILSLRKER